MFSVLSEHGGLLHDLPLAGGPFWNFLTPLVFVVGPSFCLKDIGGVGFVLFRVDPEDMVSEPEDMVLEPEDMVLEPEDMVVLWF